MKPVAELHPNHLRPQPEQAHWCREVLLYSGDSPHDFLNGENSRVKLYTADQLRQAKVEVLQELLRRIVKTGNIAAVEVSLMADEIEKGE